MQLIATTHNRHAAHHLSVTHHHRLLPPLIYAHTHTLRFSQISGVAAQPGWGEQVGCRHQDDADVRVRGHAHAAESFIVISVSSPCKVRMQGRTRRSTCCESSHNPTHTSVNVSSPRPRRLFLPTTGPPRPCTLTLHTLDTHKHTLGPACKLASHTHAFRIPNPARFRVGGVCVM
jgi:hypothetical protein